MSCVNVESLTMHTNLMINLLILIIGYKFEKKNYLTYFYNYYFIKCYAYPFCYLIKIDIWYINKLSRVLRNIVNMFKICIVSRSAFEIFYICWDSDENRVSSFEFLLKYGVNVNR